MITGRNTCSLSYGRTWGPYAGSFPHSRESSDRMQDASRTHTDHPGGPPPWNHCLAVARSFARVTGPSFLHLDNNRSRHQMAPLEIMIRNYHAARRYYSLSQNTPPSAARYFVPNREPSTESQYEQSPEWQVHPRYLQKSEKRDIGRTCVPCGTRVNREKIALRALHPMDGSHRSFRWIGDDRDVDESTRRSKERHSTRHFRSIEKFWIMSIMIFVKYLKTRGFVRSHWFSFASVRRAKTYKVIPISHI